MAGPPGAPPPRRSLSRGGDGGEEGGKRHPAGVPATLACGRDNATAIIAATAAGTLLPADAANAGAAASLCAAANYDPAREREDDNNNDNDYAWGGEGHRRNHPGSDD